MVTPSHGLYLVINANGSADKVRDACMRADFMGEREVLMQAWADYLDVCRDASGKVVDIKSKRNTA